MTKKENLLDVEVRFKLPKSAVDFIDFLCTLGGDSRDTWFRRTIQADINAALDNPGSYCDEDWLKKRFGLEPFLSEDS